MRHAGLYSEGWCRRQLTVQPSRGEGLLTHATSRQLVRRDHFPVDTRAAQRLGCAQNGLPHFRQSRVAVGAGQDEPIEYAERLAGGRKLLAHGVGYARELRLPLGAGRRDALELFREIPEFREELLFESRREEKLTVRLQGLEHDLGGRDQLAVRGPGVRHLECLLNARCEAEQWLGGACQRD